MPVAVDIRKRTESEKTFDKKWLIKYYRLQ
jgi:hypothetical protein